MIAKLTGNKLRNSWAWLNQPYAFLDRALLQHGQTFLLDLPIMGESLITGDPTYIAEIIKNKHLIGGRGTRALRPLFGNDSLIILEGDAHQTRRQILAPFFKPSFVQQFDAVTHAVTAESIKTLKIQSIFSVATEVRKITLTVIIRLIFGHLGVEKETHLAKLVNQYCGSFHNPLNLFIKIFHINLGRVTPWGRLVTNRKALYHFIVAEIGLRKNAAYLPQPCLLDGLIDENRNTSAEIPVASIFNEVLSLLLFGHDTTAVTMAWLFLHVYQNPDTHHQLVADTADPQQVMNNLGQDKSTYLKSCIFESMRLSPVVVHLTRVAEQDTEILGQPIPMNSHVIPCVYLAQHNPDVFPAPYDYKPERFAPGKDYHHAFFPFGFAARKCIGEHLALRQMQIILASFIQGLEMDLDHNFDYSPKRQMLLIGPNHGTLLRIH